MRGSSPCPSPKEPRHRPNASIGEDANKRNLSRSGCIKDVEKALKRSIDERALFFKLSTSKLVLIVILFGTCMTLYRTPMIFYLDFPLPMDHQMSFANGSLRETQIGDQRYMSSLVIKWDQISNVISKLSDLDRCKAIGLLNFDKEEINQWKVHIPKTKHVVLHLDYAPENITWESLYPEWIDDVEDSETPICPSLPQILFRGRPRLDIIAVKLPCRKSGQWSRDVARLHLQLAAAKLAASSKSFRRIRVLLVTDCLPIPSLFPCKELLAHQGYAWLYEPDLDNLRNKVQLPVGSCELAVPLQPKEDFHSVRTYREAYATVLHSAQVYVCGAIAAARSIRMSGSTRDLVILVDETISDYHRGGLEAAGWKIRIIQRIRNPKAVRNAYNEWNYSKFRLWQLTDYDKIIFIDADMLVLRNIDFLFQMPELSATGNNGSLFNSGMMVIEPSNCTFQMLMDHINEIDSYNGGDQGYLNEVFTWWHRIPKHMNFLKHFWEGDSERTREMKTRLFGMDPPSLYVIHYLGDKPWICSRDYDCNWNVEHLRQFASDEAHRRWWKMHDTMPVKLQKFCLLSTRQKAGLEWNRRQAEKANYSDGHWKIKIKDKRLKICYQKFCNWKSMLLTWGQKNRLRKPKSTLSSSL